MADILTLESVTIEHESRGHARSRIVHDVSLSIRPGEAFGLVGESGCGKSTIALSIMRYLPPGMTLASGRIIFQGEDQYWLTEGDLRRTRGNRVAMIYQDPMSSLNPVMTIGRQLIEVPMLHHALDSRGAWRRAVAMIASSSHGCPAKSTGITAFVRGVIAASMASGSMFSVSASTSTNTGRAPRCTMTFAVEAKVTGDVITSSPGPTPTASRPRCSAAVHEFTATQCAAPVYAAKLRSNVLVFGPVVIHPERSASSTARSSSASMLG